MKTKFLVPVIIGALALTACEKDDDNIRVSTDFQRAFDALYPNATRVNWEREMSYYVADFRRDELNAEAKVWFDGVAQWQLTVTEIRYSQLPQAVKTTHEAGEYGSWRVEDVDMVERADMETVYVLEVENGNQEYDLYYAADGTLVKSIADNGSNNPLNYIAAEISSTVEQFISTNYPNARIVEIDREGNSVEVDIIDGSAHREVVFSHAGEWKYTETEIRKADLPQIVLKALVESQYNHYIVDDIDFYNTPTGDFYFFELESEPKDIYIKIYPDGTIEAASGKLF